MFSMRAVLMSVMGTLMTVSAPLPAVPKDQYASASPATGAGANSQPPAPASQGASTQSADQKAHELLRGMGRALSAAQTISVKVGCQLRSEEPGLSFVSEAQYRVRLKRPNRFAIIVAGEALMTFSFICDGKELIEYSPHGKSYEVYAAPRTPAEMLSAKYCGPKPGMLEDTFFWVLVPDADHAFLNRGAIAPDEPLRYIGLDRAGERECHAIRLTNSYVQTLLWIESNGSLLPRRIETYANSDRKAPSSFRKTRLLTVFDDWDLRADIPDDEFDFTPPPGARNRGSATVPDKPR